MPKTFIKNRISNTIKETICVCVRSVSSSSFCLSPPQLQITGVGVVCRGWIVRHGMESTVTFPKKYFCQKYFPISYCSPPIYSFQPFLSLVWSWGGDKQTEDKLTDRTHTHIVSFIVLDCLVFLVSLLPGDFDTSFVSWAIKIPPAVPAHRGKGKWKLKSTSERMV